MFDIGFSEIVVIAVVALVVIGPEKLPRTARTAGVLLGRLQRYVNDVKSDINREIELDELRKMQQQMKSAVQDIETSVTNVTQEVQSGLRSVESELNSTATVAGEPTAAAAQAPALPLAGPVAAESPAASNGAEVSPVPVTVATAESAAEMSVALDAFEGAHAVEPVAPVATATHEVDAVVARQASLPGLETARVVREDPR